MYNSLLEELRFKIGEQYELNEFNLKSIESTFINGIEYENYEYIEDDFKVLFRVELSSKIILQYNGDILSCVIYSLDLKYLDCFIEQLNKHISFSKKLITDKLNLAQTINIFNTQGISLTLDLERVICLKMYKS